MEIHDTQTLFFALMMDILRHDTMIEWPLFSVDSGYGKKNEIKNEMQSCYIVH